MPGGAAFYPPPEGELHLGAATSNEVCDLSTQQRPQQAAQRQEWDIRHSTWGSGG